MDVTAYLELVGNWLLSTGLRIGVILVLMLIALKVTRIVTNRVFGVIKKHKDEEDYQKRTKTLSSVIRHVLGITILIVALMAVLGELGIEIGPVIAAAGVVGLAVGFGAQSLVKDVISGFFILLEDQIHVGDWVTIAGQTGVVERLNLKMTVLRDLHGNVHFVPNGSIDVVTNLTREYSRAVLDIGVAYREDVDEVMDVMRQVDEDLRKDPDFKNDILEPMEVFGLNEFGDSALVIRGRIKTRPAKQWGVGREYRRRLKRAFDDKDIEIPFPHTTLYMGQDKRGEAPPLHVAVEKHTEPAS
jgi:small conductance mechanosensitive channel